MTDPPDALDQVTRLVAALHDVLSRERDAIAAIDLEALRAAEADKERLGGALGLLVAAPLPADPTRRGALLSQVRRARNDLQANALLVAHAVEAIRALLGFEEAAGYDRRARRATANRPAGRSFTL